MTNRDDLHDIETRLRASLRDRAGDVETTPALYERVQDQATRGAWLRRGFAVVAAAAVVVAAVVVVPSLLPDPAPFDVVDTPEGSLPSDGPTADEDNEPALPEAPDLTATLLDLDIAHAEDDGSGGSVLYVRDRVVRSPERVVSLATDQDGGTGLVVAGRADGSIGVVTNDGAGDQFDLVIEASANGNRAVATAGADGIAWIEGRDLHVLPLEPEGADVRVLPLEGDVPDDLQVEQWVARADAQVLLATSAQSGLWSIPMDDSNVFNTAPTSPALLLEATAVDGAILPNLVTVTLRAPADGTAPLVLVEDGDARAVPTDLPVSDRMILTTGADGTVVLLDRLGTGVVLPFVDGALGRGVMEWQNPSITAAVALGPSGPGAGEEDGGPRAVGDEAPPPVPVVGTSGASIVIVDLDGTRTTVPVYAGPEVEATLGVLDVQPGGTRDEFLVAFESRAEGEASVRFARVIDNTATVTGGIAVVGQQGEQLDGLAWSPTGESLAWSTTSGAVGWFSVDDQLQVTAAGSFPVDVAAGTVAGWLPATSASRGGLVVTAGLDGDQTVLDLLRDGDGTVLVRDTVLVGDGILLEVGRDDRTTYLTLRRLADEVTLGWANVGDVGGRLELPVELGDAADDLTLTAHDGTVLLRSGDRWWWQRLVGVAGEVVPLDGGTAWTPLG